MRRSLFVLIASLGLFQICGLVYLAPFAGDSLRGDLDDSALFDDTGGFEQDCDCVVEDDTADEFVDESVADELDAEALETVEIDALNVDLDVEVTAPPEPRVTADPPAFVALPAAPSFAR